MWKKLYELLERLVTMSQRVSRHDEQIEELRRELREAIGMLHRLAMEVKSQQDRQEAERENIQLWVENQLLKFERRLPPGRSSEDASGDEEE